MTDYSHRSLAAPTEASSANRRPITSLPCVTATPGATQGSPPGAPLASRRPADVVAGQGLIHCCHDDRERHATMPSSKGSSTLPLPFSSNERAVEVAGAGPGGDRIADRDDLPVAALDLAGAPARAGAQHVVLAVALDLGPDSWAAPATPMLRQQAQAGGQGRQRGGSQTSHVSP